MFIAIYRHFLIMKGSVPLWVVKGSSIAKYSTNKGQVLSTDFVSVDGDNYHLQYGKRPTGWHTLAIPFGIFVKDEAEAK